MYLNKWVPPKMWIIKSETNDNRPIKVVFEDQTIESTFTKYFEQITGHKPDVVKWSDNGLTLEGVRKLTDEEKYNLFGDTKYCCLIRSDI